MTDNDVTQRLIVVADPSQVAGLNAALKENIALNSQLVASQGALGSSAEYSSTLLELEDEQLRRNNATLAETAARIKAAAEEKKAYAAIPVPTEAEGGSDFALGGDEGGGGFGRVSKFGSKLRALPSTQLGGGISSDAIANILRLTGVIDDMSKVAIGAGVGIGLAAGALLILTHNAQEVVKASTDELDARKKALTLIQTGTTEEIQAREKELEAQRTTNLAIATDSNKTLLDLRVNIRDTFGEAGATLAEINSTLGTGSGELTAAKKSADDANKALEKTNTELVLLQQYSASGATTQADLAAAEKAAEEAAQKLVEQLYEFAQEGISVQADTNQQMRELIRSGSQEQLDALLQQKKDEIAQTKEKIAAQYELAKQYEDQPEIYTKISEEIRKLQTHQTELQGSLDQLSGSMVKAYVASNEAAAAQAKLVEDSAKSYEGYLQDVAKANDSFYDDQIKAHDDYMGKVEDINERAAKQVEELLQKLSDKRADLGTKLIEAETDDAQQLRSTQLDDQIKYQRDVEKLTQDHQRTLKQILQDAAEQQQELIQNRDFLGLFNLNRTTDQKVQAENDQYAEQRQALLDNLEQQTEDENRHFAEQEQQRIVQYQRQLTEAQTQYNRQSQQDARNRTDALNKAQQAYTDQLHLLSEKHRQELTQLRDTEVASLQLLRQTSTQKLAIEQQYYTQALQLLRNAVSQASGGVGANVRAGAASGGSTVNLTQNITGGADGNAIANAAASAAQRTLEAFFGG